jgi:hypothetical protein
MAFIREERRTEIMPVLESTDKIAPRSVLRHRPIAGDGAESGKNPAITPGTVPAVQRASRLRTRTEDTPVDVDEWQRTVDDPAASAPTPAQTPLRRASTTGASRALPKAPLPKAKATKGILKRHAHPLLYLGIGMLAMLVLWMALISVISWYNTTMDDIHYGRPRTFQTDAFVGHNEAAGIPSHFIAINLHGHIEVIEFPGGDAAHARIFMGPQLYTSGSDLVVVTLEFVDVNGDHKPDMIVNFQGSQVVFINDQGTFRPLRPEERHQVEQFLQHLGQ